MYAVILKNNQLISRYFRGHNFNILNITKNECVSKYTNQKSHKLKHIISVSGSLPIPFYLTEFNTKHINNFSLTYYIYIVLYEHLNLEMISNVQTQTDILSKIRDVNIPYIFHPFNGYIIMQRVTHRKS